MLPRLALKGGNYFIQLLLYIAHQRAPASNSWNPVGDQLATRVKIYNSRNYRFSLFATHALKLKGISLLTSKTLTAFLSLQLNTF